jgi:fatty acid desaturase
MQSGPELSSLRNELRLAGVFEHREGRSWLKLGVLLTGIAGCFVMIALFGWWMAFALVPPAAVLCTATAMLGHEGSHKSVSSSPFRNAIFTYFAFPLFSGLGSLYWREKHDRLHHGHPNVEGVDPDIRPFPFASSRGDHERCSKRERWFQRTFQRWAFWPMSTLMAMGMRRSSIVFLVRYTKRHGFSPTWFVEAACLAGHYVGWLVIPSLIWGPAVALAMYGALWGLVGISLALIFAPAHIGLPVLAEQHHDWLHQVETTRNLEMPRFISFFFIGLDYQVEHHLFPKIPHKHLPRAAEITARWCARHGVAYQSEPYLHALVDSAQFMASAWSRDSSDHVAVRAGLVGSAAA